MRSFILIVLASIYVHFCAGQKTVRITFKDSISRESIAFLLVENAKDSFRDFTNLDGVIRLDFQNQKVTYLLSHISYGNKYVQIDLSKDNTIYLAPAAIGMTEVVVADVRRDIESMLTDVLRHLRKDRTIYHNQYAFYLETKHKGKRFEKIKAVFDATYNHSTGIHEEQLMDGEFWFNPDSLFVNLDLDTWLLNFNPLTNKSSFDLFFLATNVDKIKAKKQKVLLMECANCQEGYELFSMDNERHSIKLIANLKLKKVANCQVTLKPQSNINFINLISEDSTKVESVDINYLYNSDGNLQNIAFKLRLNDRLNRALSIDGYFSKVNYLPQKEIYYFGKYRPTTLYEKILMDPSPNRYRIDTLYDEALYEGYKINSSSGLWSHDDSMRDYFYAKKKFNKSIVLWSKDRKFDVNNVKASNDYSVNLIEKSYAELTPHITWIFCHNFKTDKWESIPSIWSSTSTLNHIDKANHPILAMEMTFDLMEQSRISCKLTDENAIKKYFNDAMNSISTDMNLLLDQALDLKKLYTYNAKIQKAWGINNLLEAFKREIPIVLKHPKYKSLAHLYSSEAHEINYRGDIAMSNDFSRLSIEMYLHFLDGYSDKMDYKMKGGIHYILADQYYLLHIKDDACMYFKSALQIWPEANQAYPKVKLMEWCNKR